MPEKELMKRFVKTLSVDEQMTIFKMAKQPVNETNLRIILELMKRFEAFKSSHGRILEVLSPRRT